MLIHFHRRLLLNCSRQIFHLFKFNQIRSINSNEQIKRKILLKMNTVLNENDNFNDSDTTSFTCLNNELILSERMVKFPFHYRCVLEQQFSICQDRWVSMNEWNDLYHIIGQSTKPVFASITMLVCEQLKHIQRGRSLFEYIEKSHPNLLTTTSTTYAIYMNLLAKDFFNLIGKKHRETYSIYEKDIIDIYMKYIKNNKQSIIASATALGIIKGLCVTHLWHEAYSYLPYVNDDNQLQAMTDLTLATLHNDDINAGIKLIENFKNPPINDSAAATTSNFLNDMIRDMFRNLNEKHFLAYKFIENLFQYLSTLDYFIEKSAIDEMQTFFSKYKPNVFNYGTTLVYPSGACKQLPGLNLLNSDLTDEEFNFLRKYLMESAYTSKEVYNTTTPIEFEKFQQLLSRNKFTMIIDGLNILYGVDRFATDPVGSMIKTINFLKNLRVSQNEMLFIGRKHVLSRIPYDIQKDLRSICEIFLVDNTSRDDWFVIYAALHSKAYVLTSDILRKERGITNKTAPIKNPLVNDILQKWLYRYQYMFIRQGKRIYFKQPMAYKLRAQYTENVWLIPYFTQKPLTLAQRPDQWFFVYKISDYKQTKSSSSSSSFTEKRKPIIIKEENQIV